MGILSQASPAGRESTSVVPDRAAQGFTRHTLRKRFRSAHKVLGPERRISLNILHGRHTYLSHALAGGRAMALARGAAAQVNATVTFCHLHAESDDERLAGCLGGPCAVKAP